MFDFINRVVVVTGAAGNLGVAVSHAFLAAGAQLVLVDRAPDRLQNIYPDLANSQDHLLANSVDLTKVEAVEAMAASAFDKFGRIDVLVHTAGGFRAGSPLHETPMWMWDFLFDLNSRSLFIASQAVIPYMLRKNDGRIITVGARPGLHGAANSAVYGASKSAVIRMTESMSVELRGLGINVNCVIPGTIDTPQNRNASPNADYACWIQPESLAQIILFLASDVARDINGAIIPVYGRA